MFELLKCAIAHLAEVSFICAIAHLKCQVGSVQLHVVDAGFELCKCKTGPHETMLWANCLREVNASI